MILILSNPLDAHADRVEECLRAAGAVFARFDLGAFPASAAATVTFTRRDGAPAISFAQCDGRIIAASDIDVIWNRRPTKPRVTEWLGPADRGFALSESEQMLNGIWRLLADRYWVNPLPKARAAESKLWKQSALLPTGHQRAGLLASKRTGALC